MGNPFEKTPDLEKPKPSTEKEHEDEVVKDELGEIKAVREGGQLVRLNETWVFRTQETGARIGKIVELRDPKESAKPITMEIENGEKKTISFKELVG